MKGSTGENQRPEKNSQFKGLTPLSPPSELQEIPVGIRDKQTKTQLPVVKSLEQKHAPCTRRLLRGGHNT